MTETLGKILKRTVDATSNNNRSGSADAGQVLAGDPNCRFCHGLGYVTEDVPVGHPLFGKALPCVCRMQEIQMAQAARLNHLSSLGALSVKQFGAFLPEGQSLEASERQSLKRAYDQCLAYAEQPRGWLLLHGGYGCGKTHLAAAIANFHLERGRPVIFVNTPDLLDHLRSTFSPTSEVDYDELFDQVRNAPLLILDDLGAESPTTWAQEKLYQIFNYRYNEKLPTVVTSNLELDRLDPRLRSRLVDLDLVRKVVIVAPDFRRAQASSETDISSLGLHDHQTFEAFDLNRPEATGEYRAKLRAAHDAAHKYAEEPDGWLVLSGLFGAGKTHLAAAIANHRAQRGHPVIFVTAADLLDHLRATFSPDSLVRYDQRFDEIKTSPLLVLDDLTLESATPWAREKLFQLIDYRYTAYLPTVITIADDEDILKSREPRLASRFLDKSVCLFVTISVPGFRGGKKRRTSGKRKG